MRFKVSGLVIDSSWPHAYPSVPVELTVTTAGTEALQLRIPSWVGDANVSVSVTGSGGERFSD